DSFDGIPTGAAAIGGIDRVDLEAAPQKAQEPTVAAVRRLDEILTRVPAAVYENDGILVLSLLRGGLLDIHGIGPDVSRALTRIVAVNSLGAVDGLEGSADEEGGPILAPGEGSGAGGPASRGAGQQKQKSRQHECQWSGRHSSDVWLRRCHG